MVTSKSSGTVTQLLEFFLAHRVSQSMMNETEVLNYSFN